jgi:hypothetical protein
MKASPTPRSERSVLIALGFGTHMSRVPLPGPATVAISSVLPGGLWETVVSPRREPDVVASWISGNVAWSFV